MVLITNKIELVKFESLHIAQLGKMASKKISENATFWTHFAGYFAGLTTGYQQTGDAVECARVLLHSPFCRLNPLTPIVAI